MIARAPALVAVTAVALLISGCTLGRPDDPVVITGAQVPSLSSVAAGDVVAFSWVGGWRQVPVQVDERKQVDLGTVYITSTPPPPPASRRPSTRTRHVHRRRPEPHVDADDEIAFMAAGRRRRGAVRTAPGGHRGRNRCAVERERPARRKHQQGLDLPLQAQRQPEPRAREAVRNYEFNLLSGDYKTTYKLEDGPNPENSTVTTPYYPHHFSDRWLTTRSGSPRQGSSGVDILDRAKTALRARASAAAARTPSTTPRAPSSSTRAGPSARSGPTSARTAARSPSASTSSTSAARTSAPTCGCTRSRASWTTSTTRPAAAGMTYTNNANTGGVPVDGVPDTVTPGTLAWETVDGSQGGLSIVHTIATDIAGFTSSSYYLDDKTPADRRGDPVHRGHHGVRRQRSVDHPGHPEHRPPHRRLQEPDGNAHTLLRRRGQGERRRAQRRGGRADQRHRLKLPVGRPVLQPRSSAACRACRPADAGPPRAIRCRPG